MFIDTHTHLNDELYGGGERIIAELKDKQLDFVNVVGYNLASSREAARLAAGHDNVFAVVGVHPSDAAEYNAETESELLALSAQPKVVAIGEIGLDYHYPEPSKEIQRDAFVKQMIFAKKAGLPVVFHVRDAYEEAFDLLTEYREFWKTGVLHCYSGSAEMLDRFLKLGLYVSFSGAITFKNNRKAGDCIAKVPPDRILTETDCPYLTPVPHRGEVNYPEYVRFVAERIAEVYGIPVEELNAHVRENALRLFFKCAKRA